MPQCSYTPAELTTFCLLDDLGLNVTSQHLTSTRAGLACRSTSPDDWCHRCGCHATARDSLIRELAHFPFGWRPTTLQVRLRRYQCTECGHVWRQDLTRTALLGVAWNTANDAVLAEGQRLLIDQPGRLDDVTVVGVDEHVWRHTRRGDKYVTTVVIDLTPVSTGAGPSRLLTIVGGRSKQAFKTWLSTQPQDWRDGIRIIAMDGFTGFTGFTTAATEVMDPFHLIRLAGLIEIAKLGRTLTKRRDDILAFPDHTGSSNDPTEAINDRLGPEVDLFSAL